MGHTESREAITPKDLDLVKAAWSSIESKETFGIDIMVRLFLEHKEIKTKWIFASNLETEEEVRFKP
jgi:hypothetical protein